MSIQEQVTTLIATQLPHKLSLKFKDLLDLSIKRALPPFSKLPKKAQERILTAAMNKLFQTELTEQELSFLFEQWLKITITDANYLCYITVFEQDGKHSFRVSLSLNQDEDVHFQADSASLLELFSQSVDPDTLFFQRKLLITGDTELGLEIKNFLDDLERNNLPCLLNLLLTIYKQQ